MQINRLFEIIYILLYKDIVTAKELAEKFEVSTRTIYRDVETLSGSGIPIYMTKGKGGGISLLPDYILNKTVLTDDERNDILSSLKAMTAINFNQEDSTMNKLSHLFGEHNSNWIEVDFSSWANPENEKETFNTLKHSILNKKVVSFSYSSAKTHNTSRYVEPLKIVFKSSAWYLYGYCKLRHDFRFFKLRRINELKIIEESFQKSAPDIIFEDKKLYDEEFVNLKLKLSPKVAFRVYDEFEIYSKQPDGSFIAEILYPKGHYLFYYISSFGKDCEVLEPKDIRDSTKKEFQEILNNYL